MTEKFKILSIDGGGIRGVYPAMYLALFEEELKEEMLRNGKSIKISI